MQQIKAPYMFDWEHHIAVQAMQGNWPHLEARENSHVFSRDATGTWCIFSSYGIDDPSKLMFVQ